MIRDDIREAESRVREAEWRLVISPHDRAAIERLIEARDRLAQAKRSQSKNI
jgi:hypothetical protein